MICNHPSNMPLGVSDAKAEHNFRLAEVMAIAKNVLYLILLLVVWNGCSENDSSVPAPTIVSPPAMSTCGRWLAVTVDVGHVERIDSVLIVIDNETVASIANPPWNALIHVPFEQPSWFELTACALHQNGDMICSVPVTVFHNPTYSTDNSIGLSVMLPTPASVVGPNFHVLADTDGPHPGLNVSLLIDNRIMGIDTTRPFEFSVAVGPRADGLMELLVIAYDSTGVRAISSPDNIYFAQQYDESYGLTAVIGIDASDLEVDTCEPFSLNAADSYIEGDEHRGLECRWDFDGDFVFDTDWSSTYHVDHAYAHPGIRTIRLEVRDDSGHVSFADTLIHVDESLSSTGPEAQFSVSPEGGSIDSNFVFDASISENVNSDHTFGSYRWDWENDGVFDTDWTDSAFAEHQFPVAATYTTRLEVRNAWGCTDEVVQFVQVSNRPLSNVPMDLSLGNSFHYQRSVAGGPSRFTSVEVTREEERNGQVYSVLVSQDGSESLYRIEGPTLFVNRPDGDCIVYSLDWEVGSFNNDACYSDYQIYLNQTQVIFDCSVRKVETGYGYPGYSHSMHYAQGFGLTSNWTHMYGEYSGGLVLVGAVIDGVIYGDVDDQY